jgi:signal recognition particle subunit SRP72
LCQAGLLQSHDARTNLVAAYVSAGRASEVSSLLATLGLSTEDNYVAAYNAACADLELERMADAARRLATAQRLGRDTLLEEESGLSEAEVQAELLPIFAQAGHQSWLQGRLREATQTYTRLAKLPSSDVATAAVVTNNLVAIRGNHEVFDSLKRLDKLMGRGGADVAPVVASRLSVQQRKAVSLNRATLLLLANKVDQCRAVLPALAEKAQDVTTSLLQAALLVRDKKFAQADQLLEALPAADARVCLMRAQIAIGHMADSARGLSLLETLPTNVRFSPRVTATAGALLEACGEASKANATFDEACRFWEQQQGSSHAHLAPAQASLAAILAAAARYKATHNEHKAAAGHYARLLELSQSDSARQRALQCLTRTLSTTDVGAAEQNAERLAASLALLSCDAEELDTSPQLAVAASGSDGRKRGADGDEAKVQVKQRKRKPRYPVGFDPAAPNNPPPDPERWLPKRERAAFKNKKKAKAAAAALRGSQGTVASQAPAAAAVPAPAAGPSGGKGKKKR